VREGAENIDREAFLEGLQNQLRAARLHPKAPSVWDETDITCDSALFWRVRIVSYEGWGTFYLRLSESLRPDRLLVPALGVILLGLWSPIAAAVATVGLLVLLLLEGWIFGWRVGQVLTTVPPEDSSATN